MPIAYSLTPKQGFIMGLLISALRDPPSAIKPILINCHCEPQRGEAIPYKKVEIATLSSKARNDNFLHEIIASLSASQRLRRIATLCSQ